ncbi:MATE family efflux transporter [Chloroflexota bacterium]
MISKSTERLGTAPLGRLLLSLSLPGMASMATMALYNITDTFWVAKLGHEAIAALTIVLPYHILVIAISVGSGIGINALVSRRFGERDIEVINRIAGQVFPISVFFGLIFIIAAVFFTRQILTVAGATADIMEFATQYLVIISFGAPLILFSISTANLLRGSGDALRPMIFMITASVVNIILDPFLIFGIGPFPEMGVRGAAFATVVSQGLGAGLSFIYIVFTRRSAYTLRLHNLQPNWRIIKDIYRVGLPAVVMDISQSLVFAMYNNALSVYGSIALAAGGLSMRIIDLVLMPIFGASGGLLPIVGYSLGARLWGRLWRAVIIASVSLVLIMVVATVALEITAPLIIGLFTQDPQLVAVAVPAMRIVLSSLAIIGPAILFVTTFQGLSKGKEALVLSLVRQLVFFVPILLVLPRLLGLTGVWLALPLSDFLGFIVAGAWILREYRIQRSSSLWLGAPMS